VGTILVATADAGERRTIADAFRLTGNDVVEAATAEACRAVLERPPAPAGLVLDPRLPGLEGANVLRMIRRNPALAGMRLSLLAGAVDPPTWEFLGRQMFDVVVEESGVEAAGRLAAASGPAPKTRALPAEDLKRILVVEDEPTYALLLGTEFRAHGWETLRADDAAKGLAILGAERVDALLSDINMAGMPGNELAFEVRRRWPAVKVVLMTGMPRDRYPPLPPDVPVLPKPISVRELMAAMRFMKQG
jgi:DNA-binding response OmpR family regulator